MRGGLARFAIPTSFTTINIDILIFKLVFLTLFFIVLIGKLFA